MLGFIHDHFDKLTLMLMIIFFSVMIVHVSHDQQRDSKLVDVLTNGLAMFSGALITLMTGGLLRKNGGSPPK